MQCNPHPVSCPQSLSLSLSLSHSLSMHIVILFSGESDDSPPKVSEKAQVGEFVARISIIDPDTKQEYNNVSISLEGGDSYFGLETVNSAVYLVVGSKKLDREIKPSFTLMVVAKDKSNPYLNASTKFTIYVEDDNDSAPTFEVEEYHASVLEMAEPGSVVIQVKARDEDSGDNAQILYELVSTPETHNWFEINEETGVITTKSHVDCEIDPTPIITVLAKDSGKPPLTGSATVVVHLIDTNDTPSKPLLLFLCCCLVLFSGFLFNHTHKKNRLIPLHSGGSIFSSFLKFVRSKIKNTSKDKQILENMSNSLKNSVFTSLFCE